MPYAEQFTVLSRTVTGTDGDGNDVYSETNVDVTGAFAPAGSTELVQGRATVITHDTLYLDEGATAPGAQDQMLVRGTVRFVEGVAAAYRNPFTGWAPGPVVRLVAVTG